MRTAFVCAVCSGSADLSLDALARLDGSGVVETVDWATDALQSVDDLGPRCQQRRILAESVDYRETHIIDRDGLGLSVLDVGDTVLENLSLVLI